MHRAGFTTSVLPTSHSKAIASALGRVARRAFPLLLALVASIGAARASAAPPTYRVEEIGAGLTGFDMNERGDAVGRALDLLQRGHAFVARRGAAEIELLPVPAPWISSDAYAISPNGVIVGAVSTASIASIGSRAAAWHPTKTGYAFTLLTPYPGDVHSTATAVNSHGDVVGGSGGLGLGSYPRAVRFTPKGAQLLPEISLPADVNEERVVLAWNQLLDLDDMSIATIPLPPGNWQGFIGTDLSDSGNFCGYVLGFSGCSNFPLRYRPDVGWEFVGGCATTTAANSINDAGDVSAYVQYGGIWMSFVGETNVDPTALLAPNEEGWAITSLTTVTNRREILASGRPAGSTLTRLVRMVPVRPEDLDGDGVVAASDLAILLAAWGLGGSSADLDGSGVVDAGDLARVLAAWDAMR